MDSKFKVGDRVRYDDDLPGHEAIGKVIAVYGAPDSPISLRGMVVVQWQSGSSYEAISSLRRA